MGRSSCRTVRSGSIDSDIGSSCSTLTLPGAIEAASFLFKLALTLHRTEYEEDQSNESESVSSSSTRCSNGTNFLHTLMRHRPSLSSSASVYHSYEGSGHEDIRLIDTFLLRASHLDNCNNSSRSPPILTQSLLQQDRESGYSPLHEACLGKNLLAILLMLRYSAQRTLGPFPIVDTTRWPLIHPMKLLDPSQQQQSSNNIYNSLPINRPNPSQYTDNILWNMVSLKDKEGLTPLQLLSRCFVSDFNKCRTLLSSWLVFEDVDEHGEISSGSSNLITRGRSQSLSFHNLQIDDELEEFNHEVEIRNQESSHNDNEYMYGCEVMTFGKPDHFALGTLTSERNNTTSCLNGLSPSSVRPKRVETFAVGEMGRKFSSKLNIDGSDVDTHHSGPAVAVAAGTHHSLVVTQKGHLYSFGLGKGGRLGTGNENHYPLPVRILGPLERRHVVAVSAGTNHSLCVTKEGIVYAWGQNGFGQLGIAKTGQANASAEQKFLPRKLELLRQSFIIMVAAGERHSMALSRTGEVWVWGDNRSGQLGLAAPLDSNNNTGRDTYLPTRLNSGYVLGSHRGFAISVAASEFSSLVLTRPFGSNTSSASSRINSIYEFGHGCHTPTLVSFPSYDESIPKHNQNITRSYVTSMKTNPIAMACAKYHNVAITDDGRVYTWGLHSSDLGTSSSVPFQIEPRRRSIGSEPEWEDNASRGKVVNAKRASSSSSSGTLRLASPQLVKTMLPENGGGRAVQVAASENHTCVLTDAGNLYSWGTAYGNEILGHDGVKYVSTPMKVPGVHRAVGLASAKEHTILMLCTKLPALPSLVQECTVPKLQDLVTRKIASHIDLFNVVPMLNFAERIQSFSLIDYCNLFVRCNLDGILSVGRKSEFELYLIDVLNGRIPRLNENDEKLHPLLHSLVHVRVSDCSGKPLNWMNDCMSIAKNLPAAIYHKVQNDSRTIVSVTESFCQCNVLKTPKASERARSIAAALKANIHANVESTQLALDSVSKEVRTIKKKLTQISELENFGKVNKSLSSEQVEKFQRRPLLEADLNLLEPLLRELTSKVKLFESLRDRDVPNMNPISIIQSTNDSNNTNNLLDSQRPLIENKFNKNAYALDSHHEIESQNLVEVLNDHDSTTRILKSTKLFCSICSISCPDSKSYELHVNGRKHFNTLRQKNEQPDSLTRTSLNFTMPTEPSDDKLTTHSDNMFAWGKPTSLSVTPRYSLPIPSRASSESSSQYPSKAPLLSSFDPMVTPKKSFRQIMEEEEKRSSKEKKSSNHAGSISNKTAKPNLSDSKRPTLLWTSPLVSPTCHATSLNQPAICLSQTLDPSQTNSPSSVWTTKIQSSTMPEHIPISSIKKTILDIQQEEINFKTKEDKAVVDGKWYIRQRERAPSISVIQQEESEAKKLQILIEEQRRIEQQLMEDLKKTAAMKNDKQLRGNNKCKHGGNKSYKNKSGMERNRKNDK